MCLSWPRATWMAMRVGFKVEGIDMDSSYAEGPDFSLYAGEDAFHDEDVALLDAAPTANVVDLSAFLRTAGLAADADSAAGGGRQLDDDLSWQDYAVCNQSDPEAFFPEKGGSTKQAKSVCRRCAVTEECLQYALKYREAYGIWGGKSEEQRRQILKEINAMAEAGLGRAG